MLDTHNKFQSIPFLKLCEMVPELKKYKSDMIAKSLPEVFEHVSNWCDEQNLVLVQIFAFPYQEVSFLIKNPEVTSTTAALQ